MNLRREYMAETDTDAIVELVADQLTGDITSFLIDRFRSWEAAFRYMDEEAQKNVIAEASQASRHLVEEVVRLVAGDGIDVIPVRVKKVENDGDKIKVTMEARKESECRYALFDAAGHMANLTVIDATKYEGGEEPAPDPDQPDLPGSDTKEAA